MPSYKVSTDGQASVTEGGTETFSVSTTGVAANTSLYYTLSGVTASEVVGGTLTGMVTVGGDGSANIPVTLTGTPGQGLGGSLTASLSTTAGGGFVASAAEVLTETAAPPATYALFHDFQPSISEGGTEVFTLATTNVAANTLLYYALSGVTASEVVGGHLTGSITIGSDGTVNLPVTLTGTPGQGLSGSLTASLSTTSGGPPVASASVALVESITTDLGSLGGGSGAATGINTAGQIVGQSYSSGGVTHAFLWQPPAAAGTSGTMIDLGTLDPLGGGASWANGINGSGQVVGYSTSGGAVSPVYAFLWQNGTMTNLATLGGSGNPGSVATAINDSGQVVGYTNTPTGNGQAFLWQNGTMTNLGSLAPSLGTLAASQAMAINKAGQVVGQSVSGSGASHAFLWQNGTMSDLGTLTDLGTPTLGNGNYSEAVAINSAGQVAGWSTTNNLSHAFLWQNGTMTDLGTLGGSYSQATGINSAGQVVGYSTTTGEGAQDAFVWQSGRMTDLNSLLAVGSGWVLSEATGINDSGEIVGDGTHNGVVTAFELMLPSSSVGHITIVGTSSICRRCV